VLPSPCVGGGGVGGGGGGWGVGGGEEEKIRLYDPNTDYVCIMYARLRNVQKTRIDMRCTKCVLKSFLHSYAF